MTVLKRLLPRRLVSAVKKNRLFRGTFPYVLFIKNQLHLRALKTPSTLFIFITSRCNARCRHCFYWRELNSGEEMTLEQYRKIFSSLRNRLRILVLTGGEPTLHRNLGQFVDWAVQTNNPRLISIPTNGLIPERVEKLAFEVCRAHPRTPFEIPFSLDGLRDFHDNLRGVPGCFDAVMTSLQTLSKMRRDFGFENLILNVVTTVGEYNYLQLEELFSLLKENRDVTHKVQLARASSTGVFGANPRNLSGLDPPIDLSLPKAVLEDIGRTLSYLLDKYEYPVIQKMKIALQLETLEKHGNRLKCVAGIQDGIIYQNGDVAGCEMLRPVANLKDYDDNFAALWNSDRFRRFVQGLHCSCVHNCNIVSNMQHNLGYLRELWAAGGFPALRRENGEG